MAKIAIFIDHDIILRHFLLSGVLPSLEAAHEALLGEEKPDVIVHPTVLEGLFVSDLIRWGRAHGVPTVYLMNSWDNPAVKAVAVGAPDRLVVWGEHSKQVAHERLGVPLEH